MKKISFQPTEKKFEKILDPPVPAERVLPDWYKGMSGRIVEKKQHLLPGRQTNSTMKTCMPIYDAVSSGYIITSPCDVEFADNSDDGYRVRWEVSWQVISAHSHDQVKGMPVSEEYEPVPFKWNNPWRVYLPKGYSLLYTHPFFRNDLPFLSMTGIVDNDKYHIPVNIPFLIKKNFQGIIEKGTPIAQIIPIKRDNWKSSVLKYDEHSEFDVDNLKTIIRKSYKKRWWERKRYA